MNAKIDSSQFTVNTVKRNWDQSFCGKNTKSSKIMDMNPIKK